MVCLTSLSIVMEYANEGDLAKRITDNQKKGMASSEGDIWNIFIQIVRGLGELHRLNIFHRDIKVTLSRNSQLTSSFTREDKSSSEI